MQSAAKKSPKNHEVIYQLGSIYYKVGDLRYISSFDRLLDISYTLQSEIPYKYFKAFILIAQKHFDNRQYKKVTRIAEFLPEDKKNYETNLIIAKAYHNLGDFEKAIEYYEKLSLNNEDKYMLCLAYAGNGMNEKAKTIMWDLSFIDGYIDRAKRERTLSRIAYEIIDEKIKIEEAKRKAEEEERRRIEEEEKERRREEEERIKAEELRLKTEMEEKEREEAMEPIKDDVKNTVESIEKKNENEIDSEISKPDEKVEIMDANSDIIEKKPDNSTKKSIQQD